MSPTATKTAPTELDDHQLGHPHDSAAVLRRRPRQEKAAAQPNSRRIYDRDAAAVYLGCSVDVVDRLIQCGELPVVRLPVERAHNGRGRPGVLRRIGIDVNDMDELVNLKGAEIQIAVLHLGRRIRGSCVEWQLI